jgi:hypothetical protein
MREGEMTVHTAGEHRIRQLGEHEALAELGHARKIAVESYNAHTYRKEAGGRRPGQTPPILQANPSQKG